MAMSTEAARVLEKWPLKRVVQILMSKKGEDLPSEDDEDTDCHSDRKELFYCRKHRREVCRACFQNHTMHNNTLRANDAATNKDDINPMLKVATQFVLEQDGEVPLGVKECKHCGLNFGKCTGCDSDLFCSRSHQATDYENHKAVCPAQGKSPGASSSSKSAAAMPTVKEITWKELERMYPSRAAGKQLEVLIASAPSSVRWTCDARDTQGYVRKLVFNSRRPPKGLRKGCVLRWRNPRYHRFSDDDAGARIENDDLPNITISDS